MIGLLVAIGLVLLSVFAAQLLRLTGGSAPDLSSAVVLVLVVEVAAVGVSIVCVGVVGFAVAVTVGVPRVRFGRPAVLRERTAGVVDRAPLLEHPRDRGRAAQGPARTVPPATHCARGSGATDDGQTGDDGGSAHREREPPKEPRPSGSVERRPGGRPESRPSSSRPTREEVGGVRIVRDAAPAPARSLVDDSLVLRHACLPTRRPIPTGEVAPATSAAADALRAATTVENIVRLRDWEIAGRAGRGTVSDLRLSEAEVHTLQMLACLSLSAPMLLAQLLQDPPLGKSAIHARLQRLHAAGLVARATAGLMRPSGRPPVLYAIAPDGLKYLRARHEKEHPDQKAPHYLSCRRKLPRPGRGERVPHQLAVQVALAALAQYAQAEWCTPRMPGGTGAWAGSVAMTATAPSICATCCRATLDTSRGASSWTRWPRCSPTCRCA